MSANEPSDLIFSIGDVLMGVATCAVQIEGGDRNNNWYDWAQQPGTIKDGSSPERATDHWRRWREDTDLMAQLGLQTYRMGLEWSRLEPEQGRFERDVVERYREEIRAVKAAGIVPLVTLHHFTNPSWLQRAGEWTQRSTVERFLEFTRFVVEEFGDLVTDWCTINEPNVYASQSCLWNQAPPTRTGYGAVRAVLRNFAEAHCRAYDLIHEIQPEAKVGFAHHMRVFEPLDRRNPMHHVLTKLSSYLFQDAIADAMLLGRFGKVLGQPDTVEAGRRYFDYLGINYYSRTAVSKLDDGTFPGAPINDLGWEIHPDGLVQCVRELSAKYGGPVWITENGTCDNTDPEAFRCRFLADQLQAMSAANLPVERYYHWCFVDNWEWNDGDEPHFGIVAMDPDTGDRTVKPSGRLYADIIAHRGLTRAAYEEYVAPQRYKVLDGAPA